MTITAHSSTKTLAILDIVVATLVANIFASVSTNDIMANFWSLLIAVLIPTGLIRWKTHLGTFRSLPIWQMLFTLVSVLALSITWIFALLASAGSMMRLGTPETNFIMLN